MYTQLPPSAVFCVAIFDNGTFEGKNKNPFKEGGYMHFPNMRCTERDGLELKWSDNVTTEQERQGWKVKVTKALSLEDPRVIEIQQ